MSCTGTPKPFVCNVKRDTLVDTRNLVLPRHDVNTPGALVMPRPSAAHQVKKKRKKITSSWSWHFPETVCAALRCQLCKNYGRISHRVGVIQKKEKKTELIEVFPWIQEDLWRICTNFMVKWSCGYYFNHDSWYSQSRYSVLNHFAVVCTCLFMFFFFILDCNYSLNETNDERPQRNAWLVVIFFVHHHCNWNLHLRNFCFLINSWNVIKKDLE